MFSDDEDRRLARLHAERALALDPANSYVLLHCAETALYSAGDIDKGRALADEALVRNPSDPRALAIAANARRFDGEDAGRSVALIDQAKRLSPRDRRSYSWEHYSNWCHWQRGDYEAMEAAVRRSIELYSRFPWIWVALVSALGLQQRWPEAARAAAALRALMPQFSPAAFFETACSFYGRRFPGEAEAGYTRLREILEQALGRAGSGATEVMTPRRHG